MHNAYLHRQKVKRIQTVHEKYSSGMTMQQIADEMGVSRQRVWQLLRDYQRIVVEGKLPTTPVLIVETSPCPRCKRTSELLVDRYGYERWKNGALIQVALPDLTAAQREQLITGYHSECFELDTLEPDNP